MIPTRLVLLLRGKKDRFAIAGQPSQFGGCPW